MAQTVKNLPTMQETQVRSLGWEDPLEKGMATHSSILDWRIPWTEELVGYSPWSRKESGTTDQLTISLYFLSRQKYNINENRIETQSSMKKSGHVNCNT